MKKRINHNRFHDESKTRTHKLSKLPDDGDPKAPNNLLTPAQKKNTSFVMKTDIDFKDKNTRHNVFHLTQNVTTKMLCDVSIVLQSNSVEETFI